MKKLVLTFAGLPEQAGDMLRTQSSSYRIQRSADGLTQTICEATHYHIVQKPDSYRCTLQKSLDGTQIPVFRIPRRLG